MFPGISAEDDILEPLIRLVRLRETVAYRRSMTGAGLGIRSGDVGVLHSGHRGSIKPVRL